jgi:hypothetical protein
VPVHRATATVEHLHLVADYLCGVAILPGLVLPFAGADRAFNIDLGALAQVLAGNLCQFVEEHHTVPLGALLRLAGLFVFPGLGGGETYIGHGAARGHESGLRISAEIAYQDHFVDATRSHNAYSESAEEDRRI